MPLENLQQAEDEWVAQVRAACAALTALRELDLNAVIEDHQSRHVWLAQMTALHHARLGLAQATETVLEAQNACYDLLLAAGQGRDYDPSDWQKARKLTSTKEAGSKRGSRVKERYGPDFFGALGKAGGQVTKNKGADHYAALGKGGGAVANRKLGPAHFSAIGKKVRRPGSP